MRVGILGAGVAGLSSAYFLKDVFPDLEAHEASAHVGGLARSFQWHGFDCDLAPHRLYTDDEELLRELLALVPMSRVRRRSRIFLQGVWIQDPVNAAEMIWKLPPRQSLRLIRHYLFRQRHMEDSFESMVLNKFGKGLNEVFFKPYSEKLFGIPADEISAEWGRRKIRVAGLRDMLMRRSRLYFKEFYYPRHGGYGAICERLYRDVKDAVRLQSQLIGISRTPDDQYECRFATDAGIIIKRFDLVISTLPLSFFAGLLGLDLKLRFRPARITYLLVNKSRATGNQWFYFADREFIINRVAEFKNIVDGGLPAAQTVLCCEVTDITRYSPERVISELARAGVITERDVLDTKIIDLPYAYPIYDRDYERQMEIAREFFAAHPNLRHVGRHAQFAHKDVDEIFDEARRMAGEIIERGRATPNRSTSLWDERLNHRDIEETMKAATMNDE